MGGGGGGRGGGGFIFVGMLDANLKVLLSYGYRRPEGRFVAF